MKHVMNEEAHMVVTIDRSDDLVSASVEGEVDTDNCERLEHHLKEAGATSDLVIDLSNVTFIDSSGISTLLRANEYQRESGRTFAVSDASPAVRRVLEITGLVDILMPQRTQD